MNHCFKNDEDVSYIIGFHGVVSSINIKNSFSYTKQNEEFPRPINLQKLGEYVTQNFFFTLKPIDISGEIIQGHTVFWEVIFYQYETAQTKDRENSHGINNSSLIMDPNTIKYI